MKKLEFVNLEIKESIVILSIDNPPQNRLIQPDFIEIKVLENFLNEHNAKALVIQGKNRHFSAGADLDNLKRIAKDKELLMGSIKKGVELLKYISELEIPVIASIKGACFGGGLEIALSAHTRIAQKNSLFSFPEVELSLIPGLNGIARVYDILGERKTLEFVLSAEIIDAEKAIEIGLIDYIVEDEPFDFALSYAKRLTENRDLKVINYVIRAINNYKKMSFEEAMKEELKMFTELAYIQSLKEEK